MLAARTSTTHRPGPPTIHPSLTALSLSPPLPPSWGPVALALLAAAPITTPPLPITQNPHGADDRACTRTRLSIPIPPRPVVASPEAARQRRTPARASHLRKSLYSIYPRTMAGMGNAEIWIRVICGGVDPLTLTLFESIGRARPALCSALPCQSCTSSPEFCGPYWLSGFLACCNDFEFRCLTLWID